MAAAVATLQSLTAEGGVERMRKASHRLQTGLEQQARANGFDVTVSSPPQLPFMTFGDDALNAVKARLPAAWNGGHDMLASAIAH